MKKVDKSVGSAAEREALAKLKASQTGQSAAPVVSVPREVEVQSKAEVAQAATIQEIGGQIITKTGEVAGLYFRLCKFIRDNKVSPKLVSVTLTAQGFKRSRVSEINRVAQSSDKLFKDYEAKLIGFDKTLEFSRAEAGKPPTATDATSLLLESGAITESEATSIIKSENEPSDSTGEKKSDSMKLKAHISAATKLATKKHYEWRFNGYIVTMDRQTKSEEVEADAAAKANS